MTYIPTVAIAGLGSRGRHTYARYAEMNPDKMKITALADTNPGRVREAAETFRVSGSNCFNSAAELLAAEKLADILFICTPDSDHYYTAMTALEKKYHLLLEKPISVNPAECISIAQSAKEHGRHVVVCHVLRYTSFYAKIKEIINSGRIGEIVAIQAIENVGYYHHAHSFVRGNWRNSKETSPMILAKCCHDMDILLWLSGRHVQNIHSYGNLYYFKPEKAPESAALRCLDDCKAKDSCPYDAERIYINSTQTGVTAGNTDWPNNVVTDPVTEENLHRAIKTGPYGRCVFHCDNDVVDHQVVNLEMDNKATISFTMSAFTGTISRHLKVMGTLGEIEASMETNIVKTHVFGQEPELIDTNLNNAEISGREPRIVDTAPDHLQWSDTGHGGGDFRMMDSFLKLFTTGGEALTSVDNSVESHLACFAAEYSRTHGGISVPVKKIVELYREYKND
ncbi:MAG: Gfo/Idh/MocA family oxidoreductase [Treponema sp.]|jgi:predicted dehydrogenase|nr:Gfo/Idh/MocA family oxidoreductase [Treponema sp.]